jgi:hypothetical protein
MWRSRTASGLGIQDERALNYFVSEVPAEIRGRTHINLAPTQQLAQFSFHIRKSKEADALLRPELDQYIHVARIREPAREHRSEQSQLPDSIPTAQVIDFGFGDLDLRDRHALPIITQTRVDCSAAARQSRSPPESHRRATLRLDVCRQAIRETIRMNIRIVKRPRGEAPESVRDAWIGLVLPVLPRYSRIKRSRIVGVLSGPKGWLAVRLKLLFGGGPQVRGYLVDTLAAVDFLQNVNPVAAAWWRTNTPHLLERGLCLIFEEECCVVENPDASS